MPSCCFHLLCAIEGVLSRNMQADRMTALLNVAYFFMQDAKRG